MILIVVMAALILVLLGVLQVMKNPGSPTAAVTPSPSVTAAVTSTPVPASTSTPTPTPASTPTPEPTATPADTTSDDSLTRVINKAHPISQDYVPADLRVVNVTCDKEVQLRSEAADQLEAMFAAAESEGVYLRLVDGYRSYEEQVSLYNTYVARYGTAYAEGIDDHPGASEHQLGLAVDIGNWNYQCTLQTCFTHYESYDWLIAHSWEYGWILRYPEDMESVTGIWFAPWHYRYVGVEEAKRIYDSGLTMEDYYGVSAFE